jgi:hypothetical protein
MAIRVKVPDYTREELTKLRCFITGYKEGRKGEHFFIPGEDILRQLIQCIDKSKGKKE